MFCLCFWLVCLSLFYLIISASVLFYWTGNYFFWYWVLLSCYRMAYLWHDLGVIWIHCALQVYWIFNFMNLMVFYLIYFVKVSNGVFFYSGFWPTLAVFMQKIPILGWLFQQPYVRSVCLTLSLSLSLHFNSSKHLFILKYS